MISNYIRLDELARTTRLPAAWLKREADAGRLPVIRAGKMRLFDVSLVLRALAERQQPEGKRAK